MVIDEVHRAAIRKANLYSNRDRRWKNRMRGGWNQSTRPPGTLSVQKVQYVPAVPPAFDPRLYNLNYNHSQESQILFYSWTSSVILVSKMSTCHTYIHTTILCAWHASLPCRGTAWSLESVAAKTLASTSFNISLIRRSHRANLTGIAS